MSFSICSPCCLSNSGLLTRRAMPRGRGVGAPGSSVAARTSAVSVAHERRTANYPPSMWDGELIQSLKIDSTETDELTHSEMLEEVKQYLLETERGIGDQLQLVDTLRQLGVAYRLEKEINDVLSSIYRSIDEVVRVTKDDLFATSLLFRLLREHGFHVSQDLFNNFKEENGSLKAHLRDDVKGVLGLYEASFLAIEGETLMDEARIFATDCLTNHNRSGFGLEPTMKERVAYALDLPLHWRMQRLHTRWFIDQYDTEGAMVPALLQFAKLDFNMVQSIHRRELKQLSRWWKDLGLGERLPFARDRLVENYLWTVGCAFDPKLCRTREATAKANCFITTIDDLYDVYGTLDELELFTDAIERWDASSISRLPDYMKICFMALHNTTNDTSYKAMKLKGINVLPYIKKAWVDICKAFFVEAKWYHEGYKPTLKEYLDNGCISVSGHIALTTAYCMSTDLTNEALEQYNFYPDAVYHSSMIFRLCNDLRTSTAELQRGDVLKSVQCYMHENNVPEAAARQYINEMISSTWKKLNGDRVANSALEESFRHVALNMPRMAQCMYKNGDGHGEPCQEIRDHVTSLLLQSIPLNKT